MANTCVLVLGTARSGTSLAAGLLHQLGVNMGTFVPRFVDWNPKGDYCDIHLHWLHTRLQTNSDRATRKSLDDPLWSEYRECIKKYDQQHLWGVKDHSLIPLLDVFLELATSDIRVVWTHRDPELSISSLHARRNGRVPLIDSQEYIREQIHTLAEVRQSIRCTASLDLSFDAIFADRAGTIEGLARLAGVPARPELADWIDHSLIRFRHLTQADSDKA